jgi:hypothetical protein
LEMQRFGVVGGKKKKCLVEGVGVPGKGEGELGQVMGVDLGFVCALGIFSYGACQKSRGWKYQCS